MLFFIFNMVSVIKAVATCDNDKGGMRKEILFYFLKTYNYKNIYKLKSEPH